MTTDVSSRSAGTPSASHTGMRVVLGLLGLAVLAIGVVLLFHPASAARSLAWLVGLGLVLAGLLEFALGWSSGRRPAAVLLGGVLVVGGVLAVAWPGVTLWTLALIAGIALIVHGLLRLALALSARRELPGWGWLALAGAVNVLIGVLAIAWPHVTVLVFSLILGLEVALFGLLLLVAAFAPAPDRARS